MNNRGFTLIELITTIALLAVIAIISFISISRVIEQSKVNDCNSIASNIKTAAMEYAADNRYNNTFVSNTSRDENNNIIYELTADELVNKNYLNGKIINPFTKDEILPNDIFLTIVLNDGYATKSVIIEGPDVLNTCVAPLNSGEEEIH